LIPNNARYYVVSKKNSTALAGPGWQVGGRSVIRDSSDCYRSFTCHPSRYFQFRVEVLWRWHIQKELYRFKRMSLRRGGLYWTINCFLQEFSSSGAEKKQLHECILYQSPSGATFL